MTNNDVLIESRNKISSAARSLYSLDFPNVESVDCVQALVIRLLRYVVALLDLLIVKTL